MGLGVSKFKIMRRSFECTFFIFDCGVILLLLYFLWSIDQTPTRFT